MRRTCRSTSWTAAGTSCREPLSHSAEREQREADAVEVIANHEVEGEACAGEVLLVPVAVITLDSAKIIGRPSRARILSVSCGHVAGEGPRGLRRRREGRAAAPCRVRIRADVLAEAAVLLLHRVEPGNCATHRRMTGGHAARLERRQRSPGSVEMVDTPAAEPRAVTLLLVEQPPQPAFRRIAVTVLTAER